MRFGIVALVLLVLGMSPVRAEVPVPGGPEIEVSDGVSASDGTQPYVVALASGAYAVVWSAGPSDRSRSTLYARFLRADGSSEGGPLALHPGSSANESVSGLLASTDGSFVVGWVGAEVGSPRSIFVQRFRREIPASPPLRVSEEGAPVPGAPIVLAERGDLAIGWTSVRFADPSAGFYSIAVRFLGADGNLSPSIPIAGSRFTGPGPDVTLLRGLSFEPSGSLLAVYERDVERNKVYFQRFRRDGSEIGREVPAFPSGSCCRDQFSASFAAQADGSFTVAWTGAPPAGSSAGFTVRQASILGGLFTSGGRARSPVFQLSRAPRGVAEQPALANLPEGGFVLVWTDASGRDGDAGGIFGRSFAVNGGPRTADYRINLRGSGSQSSPAVAAGLSGDALVVWQDDTGAVSARRLESDCGLRGCR